MNIIIDVMNGKNNYKEIILGAILAIKELKKLNDLSIILVGDKNIIDLELSKYNLSNIYKKISVVDASTYNVNDDKIKRFLIKNSSLNKCLSILKNNRENILISCVDTRVLLINSTIILKRFKNIPLCIAVFFKYNNKNLLMLDLGANPNPTPKTIFNIGVTAKNLYKKIFNIDNPTIGLLNIGNDEFKGSRLLIDSYKLLINNNNLNFKGNIQPQDILTRDIDIILCDGINGNIFIKSLELAISTIKNRLNNTNKIIRYILLFLLKDIKVINIYKYGCAIILGIDGFILKAHSHSDKISIKNAIKNAIIYRDYLL